MASHFNHGRSRHPDAPVIVVRGRATRVKVQAAPKVSEAHVMISATRRDSPFPGHSESFQSRLFEGRASVEDC